MDKKKTVLVLQVVVHRGVLVGGGGKEWGRLPGYDIRLRNRYFK